MFNIKKIIQLAQSEIGYCEKNSKVDLYNKNTKGNKNYTKYWEELDSKMQGQPWCLAFCVWLFEKCFGSVNAKQMLYMSSYTYYTPTAANYFVKSKAWYTTPKVGDLIFFRNSERIYHVGLVIEINGDTINTIEGNTSGTNGIDADGGGVFAKSYKISNSRIAGFGRPNYNIVSSVLNTTNSNTALLSNTKKGIDVSGYNPITDYKKVKNAGVEFAILKIIRKDMTEDKLFLTHLNGFKSVNIPITAVYNYSYATTVDKAKADALKVIQILKKYNLKCSVYLDVEDDCQKNLGSKLIEIINTYHAVIQNAGYDFGLYTGASFYNSYIKPYKQYLVCNNEWIARYPSSDTMNFSKLPDMSKKPNIGTEIEGWQYTSKGQISGIDGNFDFNLMFTDINSSEKKGIVATNKLNFRTTPSSVADTNIIDVLSNGEVVSILGLENDWYKAKYKGITGYCSAKYIKII